MSRPGLYECLACENQFRWPEDSNATVRCADVNCMSNQVKLLVLDAKFEVPQVRRQADDDEIYLTHIWPFLFD